MLLPRQPHEVFLAVIAEMATDLNRGAYSGKETFLYLNTATNETPTWAEIVRARNINENDGPTLNDVEFHGAKSTSQIPGYSAFSGTFEYVRRRGVDTTWDALIAARNDGKILELLYLNGPLATDGSKGWRAPVLLGEFTETKNGGDAVVATIPFGLADAYKSDGTVVEKKDVTASGGVPTE